jgi:hypothetical protein
MDTYDRRTAQAKLIACYQILSFPLASETSVLIRSKFGPVENKPHRKSNVLGKEYQIMKMNW